MYKIEGRSSDKKVGMLNFSAKFEIWEKLAKAEEGMIRRGRRISV